MNAACASLRLLHRTRRSAVVVTALLLATAASAQSEFPRDRSVQNDLPPPPPVQPVPIFFPPTPPPFGRLVSRLSSSATGQTFAPSPELANYLTEPFYPALSTRLARHDLGDKNRQKLDAYRASRDALLEELQTELTRIREFTPADRHAALESLARRQTPRLAALEATAEQLRSDFLKGEYDWSALREWRLGERNVRGDSPMEIGAVFRAYAFYQAGLAPEQRQLLREIVIEITSGAEDAAAASAQQPYLFFSPALTRVTLPADLPADVAAKIARYETKKSGLKKELFDTIQTQDRATFAFSRTTALKTLAAKQAPGLQELETLAEEIRIGLVSVPALSTAVPRSPLPPGLTQRAMEAVQARTALQKASRAKIDELLGSLPEYFPVAFATSLDSNGVKVRLVPRGSRVSSNDPRIAGIVTRLNEIGEEHRVRHEALNREIEALRDDVGRALGAGATAPAITEALDAVVRHNVQRENEDGYRDYRTAVIEPGLSPEQRRLLLGGAMRKLDFPLPGGELQPIRRPAMW